ncbi:MAG: hypothetical protein COZ06_10065 [Armatimonadetes bacterium CG_4_10_14_3_um_filter_66_18]|nr:FKBP-type peptidyl-prolyl cis-trans isomerase [Armatimonadota bacterium]PIW13205.1 MAG: hypothetical protein COW34_10880 [Armatimonadetes bacterium CG17_big_fil_post_rev_8_21_14_2_50_66_6]PIX46218.1 MAG: hypothetical protein COZ57_13175 [Armatimonadetes bacterium CG_4_8_14_3_um_filter_66_20]PIY50298.1 MAG: hypothetical protein COZ06_10065 [Armatimonadetes bacterium CG_4_10_14_3_um_filter_66_18]PJB63684.1 MAG: hypothetical protein CO096_21440 [Armatimonadetes bacterium CG_4_9_14_3_um_filter_6
MRFPLKSLVLVSVVAAWVAVGAAEEKAAPAQTEAPTTEIEKMSYAVGVRVGESLKMEGMTLSLDMLMRAIGDVLGSKALVMTDDDLEAAFGTFQQQMAALDEARTKKQAEKNLAEGKVWLDENTKKEGVVVLPSGLQYKVVTEGTGVLPTADDTVKAHYRGTFLNGDEFDSSYKRNEPAVFPVGGVIPGWQEALKLMKVGSKWQLFVPGSLAYGEQGRRSIPPNATLLFDVELLEIVKEPKE